MRIPVLVLAALGILGTASSARAYKVKTSSKGAPLRWSEGVMNVDIAMGGAPDGVDVAAAAQAIERSFRTWGDVIPAAVEVVTRVVDGDPPAPDAHDRRNLVRWVHDDWADLYEPGALAVTLTTYDADSGEITDADIVINAQQYQWTAGDGIGGCSGRYDVQNVITHEVGHLLGLAHESERREATMFPSSPTCETAKRDLDEDDLAGLTHLYAEIGPARTNDARFACAVATGAREGAPVALPVAAVIGAALFARRRRRRLAAGAAAVAAALAILLVSASAQATTARRLQLTDLGRMSTVVARGVVKEARPLRADGTVQTDTTVAVNECWKGPCGASLTVRQLGGELGGEGMIVDGTARLAPGDEVIVFVRPRSDGAMTPTGMAQGVFRVEADGTVSRDLTGLTFLRQDGGVEPGRKERHALEHMRAAAGFAP